jgi:putative transposase
MSIPQRSSSIPGTYFVTSRVASRRRLFQVAANAELLVETMQHYRREGKFRLHAFVVMPDPIHLLITPEGIALERAIGLIKGGFSHRLGSTFPVWQNGFTDHRIRDRADFLTHREYIHQNPVRAKLVERVGLFAYSSAFGAGEGKADLSG